MNKKWWHFTVGFLGILAIVSLTIALEQMPWAPAFNPVTGVTSGEVLSEAMLDVLFFNVKNLTDIMHADSAGNLFMDGNRIGNVSAPINDDDVATKAYVDAAGGDPSTWTCTHRTASVSGVGNRAAQADCLGNEKVVSGGCSDGWGIPVHRSYPVDQGWYCGTTDIGFHTVIAYANCCS